MVNLQKAFFIALLLVGWLLPAGMLLAENTTIPNTLDPSPTLNAYQQASISFAQDALQSALNFDYKNSQQKFSDAKNYFSDLAWGQFRMYLEGFGYWDIIKLKQLSVTCASLKPPRIIGQFYRFRLPMRGNIFWTFGLRHQDFTLDVDLAPIEKAPYYGIDAFYLDATDPDPKAIPFNQAFEQIAAASATEINIKNSLTFVQQNVIDAFEGKLKSSHFTARGLDTFRYNVEKHLWRGKKSLLDGARFLGQVIVVELPIEIIFNSAQGTTSDHLIIYEYLQPIAPHFNGKNFSITLFMAWQEHV